MDQNYFQFNNKYYKQTEGTAMGNCLSPFLANLFMGNFEYNLKNKCNYFPKIWFRYVDDIFAVFDTKNNNLNDFINTMNAQYKNIKFTCEIEKNGQLPFLDTLIIRNNNKIEFDIYRKDTTTKRYITSDSNHHYQHKIAAFNTMIHRLISIPLTKERFNKEFKYIEEIAEFNGFNKQIINNIFNKKHSKLNRLQDITLTKEIKEEPKNYIKLPFDQTTKGLSKMFKKFDFKLVFSNNNNIKTLLGNPKDKIELNEKSGIYKINCSNCDKSYIGQTRRSINIRFKEHMAHLKYNRVDKSSVAHHMTTLNHATDINNLKLIKTCNNNNNLDAAESLEILRHKNRIFNSGTGPIPASILLDLAVDWSESLKRDKPF